MAGGSGGRSLQDTPTWAVATVCAAFVILSILIEHGIHSLGKWFQKRQNKAMIEALEKIKAELMLLGFLSLLLTVGTTYIAKICIPEKVGNTWLPCKEDEKKKANDDNKGGDHRRKLLSHAQDMIWHRVLAAAAAAEEKDFCLGKGKVSLISQSGVHQLHIFIFVLAVFHVLYSVIIMVLGQAKMKKWKAWELETSSLEYQFTNDPARFRFAHQTSFVRRHAGFSKKPGIRWIVAFFRQFFGSLSKVDYLAIRNGFINAHFAPNSKFDFHKYIKRSMEDDFKVVLGISIPLWFVAVIFLLLNVSSWYILTWISIVPLITLVLVGTKLELVIMEMAQQIEDRTTVVRGAPVVEPSNNFFWFNRPQWILYLIHFTLFQHSHNRIIISNNGLVLIEEFRWMQMGSHMKQAIFEEQMAKALKKWHRAARERKKQREAGDVSSSGFVSGENTPSRGTSPMYLLHKYQSNAADQNLSVPNSPRANQSDTEFSEVDVSVRGGHDARRPNDHPVQNGESHTVDFAFIKN
ncbi:unnamed protein product [Ilex paraguariensis]|uniref:MLO-like protein n=1 Tax=Ilex paraguariensis TaxID=185542 RepID=A0ABC8U950_9AQUA